MKNYKIIQRKNRDRSFLTSLLLLCTVLLVAIYLFAFQSPITEVIEQVDETLYQLEQHASNPQAFF